MSIAEAAVRARQATGQILADLATVEQGVVVDSPPGAGKSTLVVSAAAELARHGARVMLVGQTNEQVDDLIDRLAGDNPGTAIGRLSAGAYTPSQRVARHQNVTARSAVADLIDHPVVVATAAKWAMVKDQQSTWPWAIIDEAYQMRSDALLRIARLFDKALFVGDPGQLDPFSTVETERWLGLNWDPMSSAVAVLLTNNSHLPTRTLPVSWRLPASAATVVSAAFYPFTGFTSATEADDRQLRWNTRAFDTTDFDRVLETAAETGWALYELGHRHTLPTDAEAVSACAGLAARLLQRGAVAISELSPQPRPVTADRIAIGVTRTVQTAAVKRALRELGVTNVVVDTANRLQGREFDVTIMLHPLSGRRDATAFHLEAGRLCVLASRHRHACIVVARAGIPGLLDAHPSAEPVHLGVPVKFPDGWEAHQAFMEHLAKHRVSAA
ncbi:MAG: AAA family ATPase [Trebonia sp.]